MPFLVVCGGLVCFLGFIICVWCCCRWSCLLCWSLVSLRVFQGFGLGLGVGFVLMQFALVWIGLLVNCVGLGFD